jgi:hypothetical protein
MRSLKSVSSDQLLFRAELQRDVLLGVEREVDRLLLAVGGRAAAGEGGTVEHGADARDLDLDGRPSCSR